MAKYTDYLELYEKDPVADGADTFNIETMMNNNWDKIDAWCKKHGAITGEDVPTTSTVGAVGQHYIKTTTPYKVYTCVVADDINLGYIWRDVTNSAGDVRGIVMSDGEGSFTAASAGGDYQSPTQKLSTSTNLAQADVFPYYDVSAGVHRKATLQTLASMLETLVKPYHAGTSAPSNTSKLWIDTTAVTGGLKYHNGTDWVRVPLAYSDSE